MMRKPAGIDGVTMETIQIKCPNCGAVLGVLDNPANAQKMVVCPNCKVRNRYVDFKRMTPLGVDDETRIAMFVGGPVGCLVDEKTHKEYPLKEGRNLIGRKPVKGIPKSDVPVETDDRGLSRAHMYIDVMKGRDGRWHYYVSNALNKNETRINGVKLEDGDRIGLKHDDRIASSETTLRLVGAIIDDETKL